MMGRLNHEQEQFFYSFRLDEAVPEDHPVREIAAVVDLSWVHCELAPYYPKLGRPSIDDDPDAHRRLCVCNPLGASALSRRASEPGLSLVLRTLH